MRYRKGVLFMGSVKKPEKRELIRNPKTMKDLAKEIINCIDLYWCGDITEAECREYINYTARHHKLLAKNGTDINPTVKIVIGARRVELLEKFLEGYQLQL